MRSYNSAGWGDFSSSMSFTTEPQVNVTLALYIHEGSDSGPVISGARVTGQDADGASFGETTDANGYVTVVGAPGTWSFTASKSGYNTNNWSQDITSTTTKHAYLTKGEGAQINILKVTPDNNLQPGTETTFTVEVEYSFSNLDEAILYVGFNNIVLDKYRIYGQQRIRENEGVYTFEVTVETKDWGAEGDFVAYANISEYPHPAEWSPLDSDVYPLSFEEKVAVSIDDHSAEPKEVKVDESTTLSFSFTNVGNIPWTFYAAVSLRKPSGEEVPLPLKPVFLQRGEQGSATWSYTVDAKGGWDIVFSIWKEEEQINSLAHSGWMNDHIICTEAGQVILTQPVHITPPGPYSVGDDLSATFMVKNISGADITLDKLLLGGRFNDGELPTGGYPDFTHKSVTLQPGDTHQYEGTFTIPESGSYHFFVAYYIENPTEAEKEFLDENNWNTSIELGEGLTDTDRIRDIATDAGFDFSLSVSPISGEVARDETVSTTVTVTLTGGTTQPVSFSVTGLPSGVSANALASDSPTISRTLTFTAASNAVLGTHTITITATGGGETRTATYSLTVGELITPQITGVNPAQPIAQSTRQWLGILGTGFVVDSQVILRIGLSDYPIPADRTEYVDSNRINVFVGLTNSGTWTAQVVNSGGRQSYIFSFTVAAQDKSGLNVATEVAQLPGLNQVGYRMPAGILRASCESLVTMNPQIRLKRTTAR